MNSDQCNCYRSRVIYPTKRLRDRSSSNLETEKICFKSAIVVPDLPDGRPRLDCIWFYLQSLVAKSNLLWGSDLLLFLISDLVRFNERSFASLFLLHARSLIFLLVVPRPRQITRHTHQHLKPEFVCH